MSLFLSDDSAETNDHLITSNKPDHPANLICTLCRNFYSLGWVTGTGGGTSIATDSHIFIAPSGVQKELMQPSDIFVMLRGTRSYLRKPPVLKPSACTPLFLAAFERGAGCCIHTHSQWAVLVTLLVESDATSSDLDSKNDCFEIEQIEQIKGIPKGKGKTGMMGYFDRLRVPIIENTAHEEDLTQSLEKAMDKCPDSYAVLVQRHGVYVWGDNVHKAKTQAESLDYIFRLAVEMRNLGLPWVRSVNQVALGRPVKNPQQTATTHTRGTDNAPPRRGRPRKSELDGGCINPGEARNQDNDPLALNGADPDASVPTKRRRGRPSKVKAEEEDADLATIEQPQKRGRGRPRKSTDEA